jgi:hypothetical protein
MKGTFQLLVLGSFLLAVTACHGARISGTYVAHAPTVAEMLQLTQTSDGQISGVLSHVELKSDGRISSEQSAVNGIVDADQLTLKFPAILSFISGNNLSGTFSGNTIHLQIVDFNGNVSSELFERSSPSQFKGYAEAMKSKGQRIAYNTKLLNLAQHYRETVANAEKWIANAEAHAGRIPNAKADYGKLENQMRSLVERERRTLDSVTRSQIAVAVTQTDIAGEQVDIQIQQIWDIGIGESGTKLEKEFTDWDGNCGTDQELRKQGATTESAEAWHKACRDVLAERAKFGPIYRRISDERADLRSFQTTAQAHRKSLVNEANSVARQD